jgi:FHA domain-containing protein
LPHPRLTAEAEYRKKKMPIKVNISLSAGGRYKPVSSHTLHDKRITVGRDKECTLTLEDTQKHVSRMHAELLEEDGRYWMQVVSKVNPVLCNGKRYAYGERVALNAGDHLTVGLYKLDIGEAEPPPPPKVQPPKPAPGPEDITYVARRADFVRPSESPAPPPQPAAIVDKVEAPASPPPKAVASALPAQTNAPPAVPPAAARPLPDAASEEATYVPPVKGAPPPPPKPEPRIMLPDTAPGDDEVTYIPPMSARPGFARALGQIQSQDTPVNETFSEDLTSIGRPIMPPPREIVRNEVPSPVDFDLSEALVSPGESTSPMRAPEPEPEVEEGFSEDLTYVRGAILRPPPSASPKPAAAPVAEAVIPLPKSDALSEEETLVRPKVAEVRPSPLPTPPAARPASAPTGDGAVQAFLEGAGLTNLKISDAESFMRDSGVMVRAAVEGLMMLMIARDEARKDLGLQGDVGAGEDPLTSMADPAEVIAFLFDPMRPAIASADPVKALSAACSDLRAHQVALLTALRAGVATAVNAIDPKKVEREHGVNLGGLNLTRKSKLWDIVLAQHETIVRQMEDDAGKAFNAEILVAYTAQLQKMRGGR